jgi:hypothetical protein
MRPLLRLASLGGWLANVINQSQLWDYDRSKSVRPGLVGILVVSFGFGPLLLCAIEARYVLGYSPNPALRRGEEGLLIPLGLLGLIALLLVVGWLVRFVPFVSDRDQTPPPAAPIPLGSVIPGHATGIFGVNRSLHRFRHRQARIELIRHGELDVLVRQRRTLVQRSAEGEPKVATADAITGSHATDAWVTSASAHLVASNIRDIRRGTAHLVSATRPAINIGWLHGPILLDFDDVETRDQVFAQLLQMLGAAKRL